MASPDETREAMLRRHAMQICTLLPENAADATRVLDYAREFNEAFLCNKPRPTIKIVNSARR